MKENNFETLSYEITDIIDESSKPVILVGLCDIGNLKLEDRTDISKYNFKENFIIKDGLDFEKISE